VKSQRGVLPAAFALIALPAVVVAASAVKYHSDQSDSQSLIALGKRTYSIHVPASYDPAKPTALVLSFHGASLWGAAQRSLSTWDAVADREGIIVAYPSARDGRGPRSWEVERPERRLPPGAPDSVDFVSSDVLYIRALIDTLSARYNVDARRIYADGLSNGGGMAWLLSCVMSDRIAAVGLVGAAYTIPTDWCWTRPPVPAIMFHGTMDRQTQYNGARVWISPRAFPSIPGIAREWARRNQCSPTFTDTSVATDVVRRSWRDCRADIELYTIIGGGHTWPGGQRQPEWFVGKTTQTIDASAVIWDFFARHPKR
jgi:polyhydroxybutyrate depolymerase